MALTKKGELRCDLFPDCDTYALDLANDRTPLSISRSQGWSDFDRDTLRKEMA